PLTSSPLSTSLTFMPFFFFVTPTPPNSTLFPYTTLFRSHPRARHALRRAVPSDPHPLAASAAWKRRRHRGHPEGVRGRARAAVFEDELLSGGQGGGGDRPSLGARGAAQARAARDPQGRRRCIRRALRRPRGLLAGEQSARHDAHLRGRQAASRQRHRGARDRAGGGHHDSRAGGSHNARGPLRRRRHRARIVTERGNAMSASNDFPKFGVTLLPDGRNELPDVVVYEKNVKSGVGRVTVDRQEVLNAWSYETVASVVRAMLDCHLDRSIGVVVLTGAGERSFCAGGDIKQSRDQSPEKLKFFQDVHQAIRTCLKPIIARINGNCIGMGNHIAYHCDLTIAAEHAKFGQ